MISAWLKETGRQHKSLPSATASVFARMRGWIYLAWLNNCFFLSAGNSDCAIQARAPASSEFIQLRATISI